MYKTIQKHRTHKIESKSHKTNKKQDRQCTYNVMLRRVREVIVAVEKQYYTLVCVCMLGRACVRAFGYTGAWACACAYVHIELLIQHGTRMRHIVTSFVAPRSPLYFSTLSHKWCEFLKKLLSTKCVLIFSTKCF
jgi:hypothetical protein